MVCHRCVMTVEGILKDLAIHPEKVEVGEIYLRSDLKPDQRDKLKSRLEKVGLELIDSRLGELIEKLKSLIIRKARNEGDARAAKAKLSVYLSENLHHEYTYLSSLFSQVEGRTIESFFIQHRIEKAKELLVYGQYNLSEIAFQLDYSSVAHLSTQFKKITGLTPSHFKQVGDTKRRSLDKV